MTYQIENTYSVDPELKRYESRSDNVKFQLRIDRVGDEVALRTVFSPLQFSLDHDPATVWKTFKDFSVWQDDLQYSNVIGDQADGSETYFTIKQAFYHHYRKTYASLPTFEVSAFRKILIVRKALRGQLLALEALTPDGREIESYYIFSLGEDDGATTVNVLMAHAPKWAPKEKEQELRATYEPICREAEERWKKVYIPRLRQVLGRST